MDLLFQDDSFDFQWMYTLMCYQSNLGYFVLASDLHRTEFCQLRHGVFTTFSGYTNDKNAWVYRHVASSHVSDLFSHMHGLLTSFRPRDSATVHERRVARTLNGPSVRAASRSYGLFCTIS